MPNLECPQCGEKVSVDDIQCAQCGFELHAQKDVDTNDLDDIFIFSDILSFPFKPLKSKHFYEEEHAYFEEYREIGARGSAQKVIVISIFNNFAVIMSIYMLVVSNPYIDIGIDPITFTFLGTSFFLILAFLRFLSFRLVSGDGNLVAQSYLDTIVTVDYLLLYFLAIVIFFITRLDFSNLMLIGGGIYLVLPSLVSLAAVHHLSWKRTIAGFILSILFTIPSYLLFLFLFNFFRKAWPYEIYDWRLMAIFVSILLPTLFVTFYMQQEEKLSQISRKTVPIREPLIAMMQQKKIKYAFLACIVFIFGFILLDNRYQSIKTERPPFLLSFAPNHDPDLLYIGTRDDEYREPTFVNILQVSTNEIRENLEFSMWVARMNPGETGDDLILLDRGFSRGRGEVLNLDTLQSSYGNFDYLEDWGIKNFSRDETYYAGSSGGVRVRQYSGVDIKDSPKIEPNTRFYSVAIHPNSEIIYLIADNKIKVVNADSLKTIDTIWLGGQLRDAAVSPDGKNLYVADALWKRIRIIPLPAYTDE